MRSAPEKLRKEQERLVKMYDEASDEELESIDFSLLKFVYIHGSEDIRKYLDNKRKQREEDRKNGIITD